MKKFRLNLILMIIITALFLSIFIYALNLVRIDNLSLSNWDKGIYKSEIASCIKFTHDINTKENRLIFEFADGSSTHINYKIQSNFDENNFKQIMQNKLEYIYAEPGHYLMGIRNGQEKLLDEDFSRDNLILNRSRNIFFAMFIAILPIFSLVSTSITIAKIIRYKIIKGT